jgi:hypothetical protein
MYRLALVPVVSGESRGIQISFHDFPVREANDGSGKRVELFPDYFGFLLSAIWEQIGEYDSFIAQACRAPVQFYLSVKKNSEPMQFTVHIAKAKLKQQFTIELLDALIDAFR